MSAGAMIESGRRRVGASAPAAAIVVFQLIAYPLPFGVWVQGLVIGLLNSLVAVGLCLVYRANRIINFAQADLGTAPATLAFGLVALSGVGYVVGLLAGLGGAIVLGAAVEFLIVRRFFRASRLLLSVATIGISQLLIVASLLVPRLWGNDVLSDKSVHFPLHFTFHLAPLIFTSDHLIAAVVSVAALVAVGVVLRRTHVESLSGRAPRGPIGLRPSVYPSSGSRRRSGWARPFCPSSRYSCERPSSACH